MWHWHSWSSLDRDTLYQLLRLRQEVFVVEQHCPYLDADGLDPQCEHLLGLQEGVLVAYARVFLCGVLRREAVIGRVLVAPAARKQGLARQLMQEAHRRLGAVEIAISAQAYLQPFYESLGYEVYGEGYDEDGIWHLPMRLRFAQ